MKVRLILLAGIASFAVLLAIPSAASAVCRFGPLQPDGTCPELELAATPMPVRVVNPEPDSYAPPFEVPNQPGDGADSGQASADASTDIGPAVGIGLAAILGVVLVGLYAALGRKPGGLALTPAPESVAGDSPAPVPWLRIPAAASSRASQRLEELDVLRSSGQITDEEYEAKRTRIIDEI